jgi:hypothetical protein
VTTKLTDLSDTALLAEVERWLGSEEDPFEYDVCAQCGDVLSSRDQQNHVVTRSESPHKCFDRRVAFLAHYRPLRPGEYVFSCDCGDSYCDGFQVNLRSGLTEHHVGEVADQERTLAMLREVARRLRERL